MSLKISRILHAGYLLDYQGTQIAFDPIFENPFSKNCYAFPNIEFNYKQIKKLKLSAVFISHYHDDHCSLDSLNMLDRDTPIYLFCVFEKMFSLIRELGFKFVYSLELNSCVRVNSFEVIPRRALDADVDSIFHIKVAGLNVLNVVDSWIDDDTLAMLAKTSTWDIVMWPFQTMREIEVLSPSRFLPADEKIPHEWIAQLKILNPRCVVPSSCQIRFEEWSWYNSVFFPISYRQFQDELNLALPNTQVVKMNPGVSVILSQAEVDYSGRLDWIRPIDEQDVDYSYQKDIKIQNTQEISQKFSALSLEQTERVFQYCRTELLEKYKSLNLNEKTYFSKPRFWQLVIYDHTGRNTKFYYRVSAGDIELLTSNCEVFYWRTEISINKLYSALECGEALTSMYMRINDMVFSPEIEIEMKDVDVLEDPLIRCLFSGAFGAYQQEQLKNICANLIGSKT